MMPGLGRWLWTLGCLKLEFSEDGVSGVQRHLVYALQPVDDARDLRSGLVIQDCNERLLISPLHAKALTNSARNHRTVTACAHT